MPNMVVDGLDNWWCRDKNMIFNQSRHNVYEEVPGFITAIRYSFEDRFHYPLHVNVLLAYH